MIEFDLRKGEKDSEKKSISVAVIGVGGAGANVLDRIALDGIHDGELVSMNTDVRALTNSVAPTKVQLGKTLTQGLGAGGDPDLGLEAARNSEADIADAVKGRDMVFVCAGLGGGTGSGAAPYVAEVAKREGAFVTVFATLPFSFEGKRRLDQAEAALAKMSRNSDALLTFENDQMGSLVLPKHGIQEAFSEGDKIISQAVRAITNLVTKPGLINIGMDDLITALKNPDSRCLFGFGDSKGDNRAQEALKQALKSPLLNKGAMLERAQNVLVQVCGGEKMTLFETELVMTELDKHVNDGAQILFGVATDAKMGDKLSVTIVSSLNSDSTGGPDDGGGSDSAAADGLGASATDGVAAAAGSAAVVAAAAAAPPTAKAAAPVEPEPEPEIKLEPEPTPEVKEPEPEPVAEVVAEPEPEPEPIAVESLAAPVAAAGLGETLDLSGLVDEPEPEPEPIPVMEELNQAAPADEPVSSADEFIVDEPSAEKPSEVAEVAQELAEPPKVDVPTAVELEDDTDDFMDALVAEELDDAEEAEVVEAEEVPEEKADKPSPFIPKGFIPKGLSREKLPVATAKKASKVKVKGDEKDGTNQQTFDKKLEPASKGRFEKGEPTVEDGEDLDIPTFLRQKPD